MRPPTGIIGAGNWIVDKTKIIDVYPAQDTLANILSEVKNNGGGAFNILVNLARLGAPFPLRAVGLIGHDAEGDWILGHCRALHIDTRHLVQHASGSTSYTDVMTVKPTGRRTFFHQSGTNRLLGSEHFPLQKLEAKILYLGYLMLLDSLDAPDPIFGTVAAGILKSAGNLGLYRVVDLVSAERPDYSDIVTPSLSEIDTLICNELEAARLTQIPTRDHHDKHVVAGLRQAGQTIISRGVRHWAVIHLPEGVYALSADGQELWQGSVHLPPEQIIGAAGAGDAFAAGLLYGLHENLGMQECLNLGVCAAAACLQDATTSNGIPSVAQCLTLGDSLGHLDFP